MRLLLTLSTTLALAGCVDFNPPPPRVNVPPADSRSAQVTRHQDVMLPIRQDENQYAQNAGPGFDDEPLVSQQMPEQPQFVDAYRKVGTPKIALFVNRSLEGKIVSSDDGGPNRRQASGYERPEDGYLRSGQYDEADAKRIDYEAIENIMTDWLSCNGQVQIVSPTMARQRLSDQTVHEMQQGRPQVLSEVAQQLGCDILIQVQAHPTLQTDQGLRVRLVAEALNIRDGLSVARAVVDMEPPLEKTTINRYTRFMTRKLMDGMLGFWSAPPPADSRNTPENTGANLTPGQPPPDPNLTRNPPQNAPTPMSQTGGDARISTDSRNSAAAEQPEVRETTPSQSPANPAPANKGFLGSILSGHSGTTPGANPPSVNNAPSNTGTTPTTIQPPKVDPSLTAPPTTAPTMTPDQRP